MIDLELDPTYKEPDERERMRLKRMPYAEFLKTPFWHRIKQRVWRREQGICGMCGDKRQKKLEVHHRTYDNHGREDLYLGDLILLCDECHDDVTRKPHIQAWPYRDMGDGYDRGEEA